MDITISDCISCPFLHCDFHGEQIGHYDCAISNMVSFGFLSSMPPEPNYIHPNCPLKKESITLNLKQITLDCITE